MRMLLVLDHPYTIASAEDVPHRRSFTAALAAAAMRGAEQAGHEVDLADLAADGFNPAMTREDLLGWRRGAAVDPLTLDYQRRLLEADHLVFAFPIWWEAMPATTKGFLDYFGLRRLEDLPPLSELKEIGELEPQLSFEPGDGADGTIQEGAMPIGDMSLDEAADPDMPDGPADGDNEHTPTADMAGIDDDAELASSEQQEQ